MKIIKKKFSFTLHPKRVEIKKKTFALYPFYTKEKEMDRNAKQATVKKEEYYLETFKRSNQDTCLIHKPSVIEGNWVQSGDLLTDCASSMGGELSLGQNLLIAYMPWEGYNFEDAILISERLVIDDLYTSVHIERYELETQQTKLGSEEITRNIPDVSEKELSNLDSFGIVKKGSWVEEGDILVGKITPINKKKISPYQKLLYTILEKQVRPIKDSSLRAPKGIKAKVIDIKYFLKTSNYLRIPLSTLSLHSNKSNSIKDKINTIKKFRGPNIVSFANFKKKSPLMLESSNKKKEQKNILYNSKRNVNFLNQKTSIFFKKLNQLFSRRYYYKQIKEKFLYYKEKEKKHIDNYLFFDNELEKKITNQNDYKLKNLSINPFFILNNNENLQNSFFLFFKLFRYGLDFSFNYFINLLCFSSFIIRPINFVFKKKNPNQLFQRNNWFGFTKQKIEKRKKLDITYTNSKNLLNLYLKNNKVTNDEAIPRWTFLKALNFYKEAPSLKGPLLLTPSLVFASQKTNPTIEGPRSPMIFAKRISNPAIEGLASLMLLNKKKNKYNYMFFKKKVKKYKKKNKVFFTYKNNLFENNLFFKKPFRLSFDSIVSLTYDNKNKNKNKNKNNISLLAKLITPDLILFLTNMLKTKEYENPLKLKNKENIALTNITKFAFLIAKTKFWSLAKLPKFELLIAKTKLWQNALHTKQELQTSLSFIRVRNTVKKQKIKNEIHEANFQKNSFVTEKLHKKATLLKNIEKIHIYLAEKRKIQVGDKMAGRHGNKGIVSKILPVQDMPFLPDGTSIDMVLNPLGVPSRMNVGQIYECLLGLAGKFLGENYKITCFDEIFGPEASRSFVFNKLYEARTKTGFKWLFDPNSPGKIRVYDGRNGECFDQKITVGQAYILRLVHMVDDKIHMRSTGPYSLVTQQPLRGRSKQGGQRLGEMEVWALEGYGAAFTLLEMLTIKSDDMTGRMTLWSNLILNKDISIGTPESFKVLICELQALCLDIGLFRYSDFKNKNNFNNLREITNLINLP